MTQFQAEMSEINMVYNVLKSIPSSDFAIIRPMEEGLKIIVENSKSSEIAVYLPADIFSFYQVEQDADIIFKIQLKRFIDCLHIFGDEGNPSMKLTYKNDEAAFIVIIKHGEENITADCEFATLDVGDFKEVYLLEECNVNEIVFNGDAFVDALADLDVNSADYEIVISNDTPNVKHTACGILGESTINIQKETSAVAIFNCKEDFQGRYDFSTLRSIMKVLTLASKVSLNTGTSGLMGMNMIIQNGE